MTTIQLSAGSVQKEVDFPLTQNEPFQIHDAGQIKRVADRMNGVQQLTVTPDFKGVLIGRLRRLLRRTVSVLSPEEFATASFQSFDALLKVRVHVIAPIHAKRVES